ncbi:MBL fold metallo-hydrolase [Thermococcus sp. Bubb.Bath]|uniref:MBL fold metallo-hydrolase n=1 Tax=Thermococcus sp. Bubb.Bath TaxID=1638242 RepID=UPI001439B61D|nr:MBL fold metallo-hydrolase [Thermococcus sp. Bubb.Bath]NJF24273.1 MBL fold metallo-hydrolase [Thermococcus sp. Bubb.Bath]
MEVEKVDNARVYVLADDYAGYNSPFWAQHGVSFLIDARSGETRRRILFDTASYAEPILFNMKLLRLDPSEIDAIVLSHSHFDHTGGLLGIIEEIKREVPVFAHPEIFKVSFVMDPEFVYAGIPPLRGGTKEKIEELGGIWVLSRDPIKIMPGVFTLGEVPVEERVDFEKETSVGLYKLEDGRIVKDDVNDEVGLAINTRKGLVVVGGCSHPGIVSMAQKAREISGVESVHAVVGGFHLIDANEERIQKTVVALKGIGVKKVYAGHCTGLKAEALFASEFGEDFEKLHAGKVIELL